MCFPGARGLIPLPPAAGGPASEGCWSWRCALKRQKTGLSALMDAQNSLNINNYKSAMINGDMI